VGDIRIGVSAAIDGSFAAVFGQIEGISAKARAKVSADAAAMGTSQEAAAMKAATAAEKAAAKSSAAQEKEYAKALANAEKANAKIAASFEKAAQQEATAAQRSAQQRERADMKAFDAKVRASQKAYDAEERDIQRVAAAKMKAEEKAAAFAGQQGRGGLAAGARNAVGTFGGMARGAGRLGMELAGAAGVKLDIGAQASAAMGAQETASLLSRKGFQEGQAGIPGQKQDPAAILKDMQTAADATAHSTKDVGDAMMEFVNKSGDLQGAREMIGGIGMLANSTGADFKKLAADAGVLSLKLDDSFGADKRGKMLAINDIMRSLSAQGKLGAIDMADLAAQLPKLLAVAGRFGGDRANLMKTVGFLAQESAKAGGSGSAAQAVTAVSAIAATFGKKARLQAFEKEGINVWDDPKTKTTLKDPMQIIKAALFKTGGNQAQLAQLFGSQQALKGVEGLRQTFVSAGGGQKGLDAINKEFKELGGAVLSQAQVEKDNAERLKESTARAQLFNNALERSAGALAERVLPVLEKAAPSLLQFAESMAKAVAWAADNPGKVIVGAIVASIAKAAIGQVIAGALQKMVQGTGGPGGGPAGLGSKAGAAMLGIGGGVAIGSAILSSASEELTRTTDNMKSVEADTEALKQARGSVAAGTMTKEDQLALLQATNEKQQLQTKVMDAENASSLVGVASDMFSKSTFGLLGTSADSGTRADAGNLDELKEQLAQSKAVQERLVEAMKGTLTVKVVGGSAGQNVDSGDIK
jgi:hypothetical protein